jgi:ornithine cyclodeaminase/alanine dehydrogenase-like protein (mu-crystallin family)
MTVWVRFGEYHNPKIDHDTRITIADSTGVAVQDVAVSKLALDACATVPPKL